MKRFNGTAGRALRGLSWLFIVSLGAAFVLAFFLLALGVAMLSLLWSLLTGRKPAAIAVFRQFHQASRQFGARKGRGADAAQADVVDVQAREMPNALIERRRPTDS